MPFGLPALLLAALLAFPQALPQTPANQRARRIVDEAIAALGGQQYLQANQRSGSGRLFSFSSTGALSDPGTQFWSYHRFPGEERLELTRHRNVIYIYKAGQGWEITYKGVQPMSSQRLSQYRDLSRHSLGTILKSWARNPNTIMLDQGLATVEQTQVESVYFSAPNGASATVDFSLVTHLPVRVSWRRNDPLTGGHYQESVVYGTWSPVGVIETPYSLDYYEGSQRLSQRYYNSVSYAPFPDSLFTPQPLH